MKSREKGQTSTSGKASEARHQSELVRLQQRVWELEETATELKARLDATEKKLDQVAQKAYGHRPQRFR